MISREVGKAIVAGFVAAGGLASLVVIGSRRLDHFDAALFAYLFATLFATFGIAYRYSMWLQRPPTAMYWRRGWQLLLRPGRTPRNLTVACRRLTRQLAANDFIWYRAWRRGLAHGLIMWGCLLAAAITFPLVFGWIHFETLPDRFSHYRIHIFGFPTISFPIDSLVGHLLFHGLVWASLLVTAGVVVAFQRRMRDHGAAALQRFGEDVFPLVLLFAVSVSGLLIWVSYEWMHGYAYDFLAILHAVTVIVTLLWLPFGKLFHVFQRPAQLGIAFYQDEGLCAEQAHCRRCGNAYASNMQVEDLILVERQLGYRYELSQSAAGADHYQRICPPCRRALLALAQGRLWASNAGAASSLERENFQEQTEATTHG
jgi:hypothetical protein